MDTTNEVSNENTVNEADIPEDVQPTTLKYYYLPNTYKAGDPSSYDGKIFQTNPNGQTTVIVPSVKKAYGISSEFVSLGLISQPTGSQNLYFHLIPNESDGAPWDLIRFNSETKKFNKLASSSYYQAHHPKASQKTSQYIVSSYNPNNPDDGQTLFLINLETDKTAVAAKLPVGESLNSCADNDCFAGFIGEISWVDSKTVLASIYSTSQTFKDENGNVSRRLIEKRKIQVIK